VPEPITVLLVEDDDAFRYAAMRGFTNAGFRVVAVRTSMEALQQVDTGILFDCLVTDIRMPAGQPHGMALANMLRARHPGLVALFMTGFADIAADAAEVWGAASVFLKPVDVGILVGAIKERCG
jgi:DNA-binding NtrC family response regulator